MLVRRDNREKVPTSLEGLPTAVRQMLDDFAKAIYAKAKANLDGNITPAHTVEQMKEILNKRVGFVKAMWCGDEHCEEVIKEQTGMPSRCIPFEQEQIDDVCPVCGKPAKYMVVYGIAY